MTLTAAREGRGSELSEVNGRSEGELITRSSKLTSLHPDRQSTLLTSKFAQSRILEQQLDSRTIALERASNWHGINGMFHAIC